LASPRSNCICRFPWFSDALDHGRDRAYQGHAGAAPDFHFVLSWERLGSLAEDLVVEIRSVMTLEIIPLIPGQCRVRLNHDFPNPPADRTESRRCGQGSSA